MQLVGARVLVVEDDDALRGMLDDALTTAGFRVRVAAHGAEALRLLQHEIPNVIVLDLMLPWVNGIEVLATLRQQPHLVNVPVLVLTGTMTTAVDLRGFDPLLVMRKPVDVEALAPTIHTLLNRSAAPDHH
jgi:DNA-binding response OmpR family regulator